MLWFYIPWKHQQTQRFCDVFWEYRNLTLGTNGLRGTFRKSSPSGQVSVESQHWKQSQLPCNLLAVYGTKWLLFCSKYTFPESFLSLIVDIEQVCVYGAKCLLVAFVVELLITHYSYRVILTWGCRKLRISYLYMLNNIVFFIWTYQKASFQS